MASLGPNELTYWGRPGEARTCVSELSQHCIHYTDVIMGAIASQITSITIVYSTVYSDADERKHHTSASLAFVWGIHRSPVNSPHKWPVMREMFPFDDVIMRYWLATCWAPNHYLNQFWHIFNEPHRNIFQWNLIWNSKVFVQESARENVFCKLAAILTRPQLVNDSPGH